MVRLTSHATWGIYRGQVSSEVQLPLSARSALAALAHRQTVLSGSVSFYRVSNTSIWESPYLVIFLDVFFQELYRMPICYPVKNGTAVIRRE